MKRDHAIVAVAFAVSAVLLLWLIHRHSVNVLFFDQWDFLQPLMNGADPWRLFTWQHGMHRMGLGYLFISAVYGASGWDTRVEAFATAGIYFVIVGLALLLKRRAVGPITWTDLFIPVVILSRSQYELFVGTPDAGHGPIALLLAIVMPLCWQIPNAVVRVVAAFALAVACAFTTYAIVFVPVIAAMFAVDLALPAKWRDRIWATGGLLACAAALAIFAAGYRVFPGDVACFRFPAQKPLEYVPFVGFAVLRPSGTSHVDAPGRMAIAYAGCGLAVVFFSWVTARVLRRDRQLHARTLFLWTACSLSFAVNAAIGRVCLGMGSAVVSRYAAYAIPLWLAAYFAAAKAAAGRRRAMQALGAVVVLVAVGQWSLSSNAPGIVWLSEGKSRWRACYLERHDVRACNAQVGFRVYPDENAPQVDAMLSFLEAHHFNLFKR